MQESFENNFALLSQKNRNFSFAYPFLQNVKTNFDFFVQALKSSSFSKKKLEKTNIFFFYGLAGIKNYSSLQKWLKAKPQRRLIFLEENLSTFAPFLKSSLASKLLKDPQVEIHLLPKKTYFKTFAEELALCFFLERFELISFGRQKHFSSFKKCLETALVYYSAYMNDQLSFPSLFQNFLANARQLSRSFDVGSLKGAFAKVPAIICGAGSSLALEKERLKDLKKQNKALIIAGGSTMTALSAYGLSPHLGVAVDPNPEEVKRLAVVKDKTFPLLYTLRVYSEVLEKFLGPLGYFKNNSGKLDAWLEEKVGIKPEQIDQHLERNSFSVSLFALATAHFLGCDPIILCGMDLAYSDTLKRYAKGVIEDVAEKVEEAEVKKLSSLDLGDLLLEKKNKQGKKVKTLMRFALEAKAFTHFAEQCNKFKLDQTDKFNKTGKLSKKTKTNTKLKIFNATAGGLKIEKIPFRSLSEIEKKYLKKTYALEENLKKSLKQSQLPKQDTALAVKRALGDLQESLVRSEKILNQILKMVKEDKMKKVDFKLLIWDWQAELAYELFLQDIETALDIYLRRFQLPFKEHLLEKFQKLKKITSECCKLSAYNAKSFR